MTRVEHEVVVIGSGPAGLTFAREWVRLGRQLLVVEAGSTPADSWRRMPRDMLLNSAWGVSCLPGTRVWPWNYSRRLSRKDFHAYLVTESEQGTFPLQLNWPIDRVEVLEGGGFRLHSAREAIDARYVVNATGYFSKPYLPDYPGLEDTSIPQLSVPTYDSVDAVRERIGSGKRKIGIVGQRITAGQLALELYDAGFEVWISNRTEIEFATPIELQQWGFMLYYPYESLRLRLGRFAQRSSELKMAGGRIARLLRKGAIRALGPIERFDCDKVHFLNGTVESADAILWATGYRPALSHLPESFSRDIETGLPRLSAHAESADHPGFYFLGLDQQTDFTSRMLRGIRRDALRLARELASIVSRRTPS